MNIIDRFLNSITMYRLMVYGLFTLIAIAFVLSFFDIFGFTPIELLASFLIIVTVAELSNMAFAQLLHAHRNVESAYITAFILTLILQPGAHFIDYAVIVAITVGAMASKYILAINRKHIFNPAAIALFFAGLFGSGIGSWWIGSKIMLIPVLIVGLLIIRKIRRWGLFSSFLIIGLLSIIITGVSNGLSVGAISLLAFTSWPLIFFGTIMLTEPLTTPPTVWPRVIYGALIGLFFGVQFHAGPIHSTPEFALVIGNIFSFIVSPKYKINLSLKEKKQIGADMYELVFKTLEKIKFQPGQYFEWTLSHTKSDQRGNRRYFTIASSPTEPEIKIGVRKAADRQSSFKNTLLNLEVDNTIMAGGLAGDFLLPVDPTKSMVFIAGGIGITPFRSMIKYLSDTNQNRNIVLFYIAAQADNFVYKDIFEEGKKIGLETHYVLSNSTTVPVDWKGHTGQITAELLKEKVQDHTNRMYYISGPNGMVVTYKKLLRSMGIKRSQIRTDYFPGF